MTHSTRIALAVLTILLLTVSALPAAEEAEIQRAVDQGVKYLRSQQSLGGRWDHPELGATALAGLALMECGVPPTDPQIQSAARELRREARALSSTYSLALALLFFDRLGEKDD